jgi:hypothetical protein
MSESTDRTIGGLTPRRNKHAPLRRLLRENRPVTSAPVVTESVKATPTLPATPDLPRRTPPNAPTVTFTGSEARVPLPAPAKKPTVSVYMRTAERDAARATYKATKHLENDERFSDFVAKAIHAEVRRREEAHNDGRPFESRGAEPLSPGRPML